MISTATEDRRTAVEGLDESYPNVCLRVPDADQSVAIDNDNRHVRPSDRVWTVDELAESLNVSTKTISRWRRYGLVGRRFVCDGRKRIGFLESSVQRFIRQNPERVRRGSRFSQLTDSQRNWIIEQARDLARSGQFPADVVKDLASLTSRSSETIRYTIKQFDRSNPDAAVFPDHNGEPREETRGAIFRQYLRGDSVEELASRFCRAKASVRRIIAQMRADRIAELPLDYIPNDGFAFVRSESEILGPVPNNEEAAKKTRAPSGLPPYLASLYEIPLLNRQQEGHIFRKMNYLKHKASKLREELDFDRPSARVMTQIEKLYDQAVETKNSIIRANLRLVVSVAKRHLGSGQDFFELVSDGNVSLMRAAEKFDFARGNKFSTYASWAIMKNFARSVPTELRHRDRFRTSNCELFAGTEDLRTDKGGLEAAQFERETRVGRLLKHLSDRERKVVDRRFGLTRGQEPLTLKEVGAEIGVTKERAQQLEVRAIDKLRKAAQEEGFQFADVGWF